MQSIVKRYFIRFTTISLYAFLILAALAYLVGTEALHAVGLAFLMSYLFVGSNFFAVAKMDLKNHKRFYRLFLVSLAARFLLMLSALIFVLEVIKLHQIFFTVSFIISYIFHSVIEIIFINNILETDS